MAAAVRREGQPDHLAHPVRAGGHERAHQPRSPAGRQRHLPGTRHHAPHQAVHADYLRVNELLARVEAEVRAEYEPKLLKLTTEQAEALKHALSAFSIARARDTSWLKALNLWEQRMIKPLYNSTLTALAAEVAAIGTTVLTPVVPPPA
ncbi:DUF5995 family protein [Actinosynnema sp. CA-248983]